MSSGMISNGIHASFPTISNPKLSTHKSFLQPSSHLSFNTHFQKSSFTIKTKPIKASAAAVDSSFYVNSGSFYDLLGIPKSGTLSEIKKAYKQLARKYHPDVSPPECKEEYTKRFLQVQEAYETLSDPKSRALYDRDMDRGLDLHTIFSTTKRSRYNEIKYYSNVQFLVPWPPLFSSSIVIAGQRCISFFLFFFLLSLQFFVILLLPPLSGRPSLLLLQ